MNECKKIIQKIEFILFLCIICVDNVKRLYYIEAVHPYESAYGYNSGKVSFVVALEYVNVMEVYEGDNANDIANTDRNVLIEAWTGIPNFCKEQL